jgi:ribosome-binding ATPase YchF (GTP1/OBG family)
MDAASRILVLPVQAQKRFEKAAAENRRLRQQIDAQEAVISDLASSLEKADELHKAIQAATERRDAIDRQLSDATAILLDALQNLGAKHSALCPGDVVRDAIRAVQESITRIAKSEIERGAPAVPITAVFDLENQIKELIDDFQEKGIFPETDEEAEQRTKEGQAHSLRLLEFLQQARQAFGKQD